jgi:hypothetical protein
MLRNQTAGGKKVYISKFAGKDCLYIWDGKKDRTAIDPIALAAKEGISGSGGGGCNAGYSLDGLVLLAGAVLMRRGKR